MENSFVILLCLGADHGVSRVQNHPRQKKNPKRAAEREHNKWISEG